MFLTHHRRRPPAQVFAFLGAIFFATTVATIVASVEIMRLCAEDASKDRAYWKFLLAVRSV